MNVKTSIQTAVNNRHLWTSSSISNDKRLNTLVTGVVVLFFGIYGYLRARTDLTERTLLSDVVFSMHYSKQLEWILKAEKILEGKKVFHATDVETSKDIYFETDVVSIDCRDSKSGNSDVIQCEGSASNKDQNPPIYLFIYLLRVSQIYFNRIKEQNQSLDVQTFSNTKLKFLTLTKENLSILTSLKNEVRGQFNNLSLHRFDYLCFTHFALGKILAIATLSFAYIGFTLHALNTRNIRSIYASKTAARAALVGLGVFLLTYLSKAPLQPTEPKIFIDEGGQVNYEL